MSLLAAQINFFDDKEGRHPAELLEAWPTLVDVAEAAQCRGVKATVIQHCVHREEIERNGVHYHFLPFSAGSGPPCGALLAQLRHLTPHVLHVHGLHFVRQVLCLAKLAPDIPIIAQDHANQPPRIWRRPKWRRALSTLSGVAFCARAQAEPFTRAGLLAAHTRIYEIPESTTRFEPGDQELARQQTGIDGHPAILWVGHLDANKDPLTVLAGISAAVEALPALRVWCCFGLAPLRRSVEQRIHNDPRLRHRVHLLGNVSRQQVEQLMRAADLFVLGSHREGSGYSLIEALACGLPPVVTQIPSFRTLTANGTVGHLWPCDDAAALCAALKFVAPRIGPNLRARVRSHFERALSFGALGAKLAAMYHDACTPGGRVDIC